MRSGIEERAGISERSISSSHGRCDWSSGYSCDKPAFHLNLLLGIPLRGRGVSCFRCLVRRVMWSCRIGYKGLFPWDVDIWILISNRLVGSSFRSLAFMVDVIDVMLTGLFLFGWLYRNDCRKKIWRVGWIKITNHKCDVKGALDLMVFYLSGYCMLKFSFKSSFMCDMSSDIGMKSALDLL